MLKDCTGITIRSCETDTGSVLNTTAWCVASFRSAILLPELYAMARPWRLSAYALTAPRTPAAFSIRRRRGWRGILGTARSSPTSWIRRTEPAYGPPGGTRKQTSGENPGTPQANQGQRRRQRRTSKGGRDAYRHGSPERGTQGSRERRGGK